MGSFKLTWVVPCVALASACSFATVKRPLRESPKHGRIDCTTARDAPQTDMILAAIPVGIALTCGTVAAISRWGGSQPNPAGEWHSDNPFPQVMAMTCVLPAMLVALVPLASMVYGYVHTGRCQRLHRDRLMPPLVVPQSQATR
jgi:hypothetical protein